MVDGAAGGTVGEHTAEEVFDLYEMLSANSQQKSASKLRRGGIQMANGVHMEEVMQHLKEIKDKLPTKTESSQDVRAELCSCVVRMDTMHHGALIIAAKRKGLSIQIW